VYPYVPPIRGRPLLSHVTCLASPLFQLSFPTTTPPFPHLLHLKSVILIFSQSLKMEYKPQPQPQPHPLSPIIPPRLILHGGAGNITPSNLPPPLYKQYRDAMLTILADTHTFLMLGHDAIDTVTFAVERLENCPLFNSGRGELVYLASFLDYCGLLSYILNSVPNIYSCDYFFAFVFLLSSCLL
jgi:hypothetical protein